VGESPSFALRKHILIAQQPHAIEVLLEWCWKHSSNWRTTWPCKERSESKADHYAFLRKMEHLLKRGKWFMCTLIRGYSDDSELCTSGSRQLFASSDSQSTLPCYIRSVLRMYRTWCHLKEQKEVV